MDPLNIEPTIRSDFPHRPVEERWMEIDGVPVHYYHRPGNGPCLVLVQGGMVDSPILTWKEVLEALPGHFDLYAPDLPGYGKSGKPEDHHYSTAYFVSFLERFHEALSLGKATFFGSSMGAALAIHYALRHPEQVDALVLSGGYGLGRRVPFHELVYLLSRIPGIDRVARMILRIHPIVMRISLLVAVSRPGRITDELVVDSLAGVLPRNALLAFARWMRDEILPHSICSSCGDELGEIRAPVLLIHGERDLMIPVGQVRRVADRFPHVRLCTFDSGHLAPRECPDEVNASIVAFLEEIYRA